MNTTTQKEARDFLKEINNHFRTDEECDQIIKELTEELAIAEAAPKPIDETAAAVRRALENAKLNANNPKITARTFNQTTYNQNDAKARELFSTYLTNKGYIINSNEENYGVDIIASKDNKEVLFELEISSQEFTNADSFIYPNVHFLARKKKMIDKEGNYHYVIINSSGTHAMTAMASDIFKEENYLTKYAGAGRDGIDEFYQLPKNEVKFFKISLTK
jgi:hypothetical protein